MDWHTTLTTLAPSILAIITVVFFYLQNRDNNKAKLNEIAFTSWWQKKVETYSYIMRHLTYLQYYYDKHATREIDGEELNKEFIEKLNMEVMEAYREIALVTAAGAYMISEDAAKALAQLDREYDKIVRESHTFLDLFDSQYGAVKQCITRFRSAADEDLKRHLYKG